MAKTKEIEEMNLLDDVEIATNATPEHDKEKDKSSNNKDTKQTHNTQTQTQMNLLNVDDTLVLRRSQHDKAKEQQDNNTQSKGNNENATHNTQKEYKSLESYKNSLNPQERKVLEKFMSSPVFDSFVTYLETFFREKDTIIHRINCYCFRAKENLNIRIYGKIYEIKQNEVIYIQKDSFGHAMLRNDKLERIL